MLDPAPNTPGPTGRGGRMPKLLALFAVVAGIVLLILERSHVLGQPGGGGSCFWIAISAALIILGVVQLLDRHAPPPQ